MVQRHTHSNVREAKMSTKSCFWSGCKKPTWAFCYHFHGNKTEPVCFEHAKGQCGRPTMSAKLGKEFAGKPGAYIYTPLCVMFEGKVFNFVQTGGGCTGYEHLREDGTTILLTSNEEADRNEATAPKYGDLVSIVGYDAEGYLCNEDGTPCADESKLEFRQGVRFIVDACCADCHNVHTGDCPAS